MELFGLLFAVPVTLVTSTVFCLLAFWTFRRFPRLHVPVAVVAGPIVCSAVIEIILSSTIGPLSLHRDLDGAYELVHFANVITAPPAVACLVLVGASRAGWRPVLVRIVAICLCWFTCMASLLGHIAFDEAIYGIDGVAPVDTR